jgi:hypothetical protein
MKHIFYILLFFICSFSVVGQTTENEWKTILQSRKFTVTKNKYEVSLKALTQIVDTITEIGNPKEKWTSSCNPKKGLPRVKLNWAATDGENWIISATSGGYSVKTTYYLISSTSLEEIRNPGWTGEKFKDFKSKYISGTIKKGSLY